MPPLPPASNVIKAKLSWVLDLNTTAESILYFQYAGGTPSAADCAALAADIQASAVTNLKALVNVINKIGLVTVQDIGSSTGKEGIGGTVTAGTRTGNANPASTCVVMNHSIARRYRGGKPRTYFPAGGSADLASTGTWNTSLTNTCNTNWSTFITTCLAATSGSITLPNYVSVSYFNNGALRGTPEVDVISGTIARLRIGTQRRRNKTA